jgi:glutamyl-tRNA synthetase
MPNTSGSLQRFNLDPFTVGVPSQTALLWLWDCSISTQANFWADWDFNRMNFIRTLLSKRKLTKFVDSGKVWGWDDPRFPTVRGIRRRGMTIPALREFIIKQGPSRNIVNLDWTLFWATNKKYIDPTAARYTALDEKDAVLVKVIGPKEELDRLPYKEEKPLHAKYKLGDKTIWYSADLLIEQADAASFSGEYHIKP